jgi:outer membrane lipoprotein-sorting protein
MRFLAFVMAAALTCAAEPLDTILTRMDASAKTANSFAAKVKWVEFTKSINDLYEQSGSVALRRVKGRVMGRQDIDKPNQFTWHFAGDNWEKFLPKAKMIEVVQVSKLSKAADSYLLLVFGATGAELRKSYDLTAGAEETVAGVKTTHLEMIPKDKKAREYAAKVEMWIPVGQSYGVQVKVTEPNGDYNVWTYTEAKVNPQLPDSAFEFTAPAGVEKRILK